MRLFSVQAPDGRILRQYHDSQFDAREALIPGYEVVGEVLDADPDGLGGVPIKPALPDGLAHYSWFTWLLMRHGPELLTWLDAHGVRAQPEPAPKARKDG